MITTATAKQCKLTIDKTTTNALSPAAAARTAALALNPIWSTNCEMIAGSGGGTEDAMGAETTLSEGGTNKLGCAGAAAPNANARCPGAPKREGAGSRDAADGGGARTAKPRDPGSQ